MRKLEEMQSETYSFSAWLDLYKQPNTRKSYKSSVCSFLRHVYKTDEGGQAETLATKYIKERRDYIKDLNSFVTTFCDKPPKSLRLQVAAIQNFLMYCCNRELTTKERRALRTHMPKGNRARTVEDDLTKENLRKVLAHADTKLRALVLFLLSSGIRVGEVLQLKLADVQLDAYPPVVNVRGEYAKEGDYYRSFLSSEAKEALLEFMKERPAYIRSAAYHFKNLEGRKYRPITNAATPPT
jgi:integrase